MYSVASPQPAQTWRESNYPNRAGQPQQPATQQVTILGTSFGRNFFEIILPVSAETFST
jgi:hypothetical protein